MPEIIKKDVERIAELARIKLNDKEKEKMAEELRAILGYIDKLKKVDTDGVESISHATGLENVLRTDKPSKRLLEDQAADAVKLAEMAPESKENFVKIPAVFGG